MKLFHVTHTIGTYVLASNEHDAESIASTAVRDDPYTEDSEAIEVRHEDLMGSGWHGGCLVYHNGRDEIDLDDAWPEKPAPPAQGEQRALFGAGITP